MAWTFYSATGEELIKDGAATAATQSALEAETDEGTYAPPDMIK